MTAPNRETLERERESEPLYVKDSEMIRRLNVPENVIRPVIKMLDENPKSGFPQKDKLFGNRRYWPKVKDWFDEYNRRKIGPQGGLNSAVTFRDRKTA